MNNKPGEQRNNQNRPNNQSTNGQQRNNNNQNRHGQSNTQNRSNQTNTNNQNRNTQNNNGSTTNQNRTSQNNNGGNNQNRGGKTVTTILVAVKIVITGITLITKTAIVSIKGKKANINKNQRSQQYQHVNSRITRCFRIYRRYERGGYCENPPRTSGNHQKLFMMGVMVNQNQALDKDTIELLAVDYGMEPQEKFKLILRTLINSSNQKQLLKKT